MTRLTGGSPVLFEGDVQAFFNRRAEGASQQDGLAATVFVDRDNAEDRHNTETAIVLPLLELPSPTATVLDAGCGAGRWARSLFADPAQAPKHYTGFDFSAPLIRLARGQNLDDRASFIHASTTEFISSQGDSSGPSSHVLLIASAMYMNDKTVSALLTFIAKSLTPTGYLYLREGVMTNGNRLTLIEEPSAALKDRYSVIYRTADEYGAMLTDAGLEILKSDDLPGTHFQRHNDTRHRYFICRRS